MHQFNLNPGNAAKAEGDRFFSVRLIDCRTGEVPSLNGIPLSVLTRAPRAAALSLMHGRNQRLWRTEVEPVGP
jgi:hypothetical protein